MRRWPRLETLVGDFEEGTGETVTLDHKQILELRGAAVSADLARGSLLRGIDPEIVAGIAVESTPAAQILNDLDALNRMGVLRDGSVPLLTWLRNAEALAHKKSEAELFHRIIDDVVKASSQRGSSAMSASTSPRYPDDTTRLLSTALDTARARRQELLGAGALTAEVDEEILGLRRRLREDGQLKAGDSLEDGRYLLLSRIGRGGFAFVWEGLDRRTGEHVAIKVLHTNLAGDALRRERFFRGASAMASLDHRAVVRVLAQGTDGGYCYFVMELVSGGDLRRAVLEGRMSSEQSLAVIDTIAEALAAAHTKRMVHRDVKPANILLGVDGAAKLTDFDLVGGADTTGGTRTGAMGTFLYAAPEAMDRPHEADARADVYSLGMTALFCLSGADLPTSAVREADKLIDALAVSEAIKIVLKKAVNWDRAQRFEDAGAFREAMRNAAFPKAPALGEIEPPLVETASLEEKAVEVVSAPAPSAVPRWEVPSVTLRGWAPWGLAALVVAAVGVNSAWVSEAEARGAKMLAARERCRGGAAADCESTCSANHAVSCGRLGVMYEDGVGGVDKNDARAVELYSRACLALDPQACNDLGGMYEYGRGGLGIDEAAAVKLYQYACEMDDARACKNLGWMYMYGHGGLDQDLEMANALYDRACQKGNMRGCAYLGRNYVYGTGGYRDEIMGVELFQRSCEQGDYRGCAYLGQAHLEGWGWLQVDKGEALRLYQKACEAGDTLGCAFLGIRYEKGDVAELKKDETIAVLYYRRACESGDYIGCARLGQAYEFGIGGIERDLKKATDFFRKACYRGSLSGCYSLGVAYRDGNGTAKDEQRARVLFEFACLLGEENGCNDLGWMHESGGGGLEKNKIIAADLYRRGCDEGSQDGCINWGGFYQRGWGGLSRDQRKAESLYETACATGFSDGCSRLGAMRCVLGAREKGNHSTLALYNYERACAVDADGCNTLGWVYEEGRCGVPADAAKAVQLFQKACDGGSSDGCNNLGRMYYWGYGGIEMDERRASQLYKRACDDNSGRACSNLAGMYKSGMGGLREDSDMAKRLYERACEVSKNSCSVLAQVYMDGSHGFNQDKDKARELFQRACDYGDSTACATLGAMYLKGNDRVSKDEQKAVALLQDACDLGDATECDNLAEMFRLGTAEIPRDEPRAGRLYRDACDGGSISGCRHLAEMYEHGDGGLAKDDAELARLYRWICDDKGDAACSKLGWMYHAGRGGLAKDETKARQLLDKGCKSGDKTGCSQLKELNSGSKR